MIWGPKIPPTVAIATTIMTMAIISLIVFLLSIIDLLPDWFYGRRGDYLHRALLGTFAALGALRVIDAGKEVLHMDGIELALACAEHAADTSGRADFLDHRALVFVRTLDRDGIANKDEVNKASGTSLGTQSASDALVALDNGDTVSDADRILRTYCGAGTESETSVFTVGDVYSAKDGTAAVPDSDIVGLIVCDVAGAFTAYERDFLLLKSGINTHYGGYLVCNRLTSDGTSAGRCLSGGNGSGHCIASGIAASSAVVARQTFADGTLTGIHIDMELLSRVNKCDSHNHSHEGYDGSCDNYSTHFNPLRS